MSNKCDEQVIERYGFYDLLTCKKYPIAISAFIGKVFMPENRPHAAFKFRNYLQPNHLTFCSQVRLNSLTTGQK